MTKLRNISSWGNTSVEIIIRAVLMILFLELEKATPFKRKIHPDEIWLYRNPRTDDYVPVAILWPLVILVPICAFILNYLINRDRSDLTQALFGFTLALGLNGVFTDIVKLLVGRPRPDFFWRCFPDGEMNSEMECTGDHKSIMDGRKSFPSGHSSFSFAGMGFLAWYIIGKFHVFNKKGRGQSWRLCLALMPLLVALVIAVSRTCDYHHHWQDVVVGSLLGLSLSYMCYRQYFPALSSNQPHRTYSATIRKYDLHSVEGINATKEELAEGIPLIEEEKDKENKWI